jgi:hypothetical protein
MRWTGHVARMVEERKVCKVLVGKPKERHQSEDRGVDGRMGSEWMLGRLAGGVDWIQLVHYMQRWQALVNTVMNLRLLTPRS